MSLSGNIYTFSTNKLTQSYNERTLHLAVTMLYIHHKTNTIIHSCLLFCTSLHVPDWITSYKYNINYLTFF